MVKKFFTNGALFFLLTLLLGACQKENLSTKTPSNLTNNYQNLLRVLSSVPDEDLKAVYLSLSPTEKKVVWLAHIDSFEAKHTLN